MTIVTSQTMALLRTPTRLPTIPIKSLPSNSSLLHPK